MSVFEKPLDASRAVKHARTTLHQPNHVRNDDKPAQNMVRFYCIDDSPSLPGRFARWFFQIRALTETRFGEPGKRFGISTATMSRDDLVWLRDQIDAELRRISWRRGE